MPCFTDAAGPCICFSRDFTYLDQVKLALDIQLCLNLMYSPSEQIKVSISTGFDVVFMIYSVEPGRLTSTELKCLSMRMEPASDGTSMLRPDDHFVLAPRGYNSVIKLKAVRGAPLWTVDELNLCLYMMKKYGITYTKCTLPLTKALSKEEVSAIAISLDR